MLGDQGQPVVAEQREPKEQKADGTLSVIFGSAAPHAHRALSFLGSERGQKVLGVGTVAAAVLLANKVTQ